MGLGAGFGVVSGASPPRSSGVAITQPMAVAPNHTSTPWSSPSTRPLRPHRTRPLMRSSGARISGPRRQASPSLAAITLTQLRVKQCGTSLTAVPPPQVPPPPAARPPLLHAYA